MDKLIITATVDSSISYPGNPLMPEIEDIEAIADHYVEAVRAGASICHHHGIHHLEPEIQADGRRLSRIDHDGWQALTDAIRAGGVDPIIQYGIASARLPDKVELMKQSPDMMSWAFNPHDEWFQPDPAYPPTEMYALHPRDELEAAARAAQEHGVMLEIECFGPGAYWNVGHIRAKGVLPEKLWLSLFFNWQGACWMPPTQDALLFMKSHLPANASWNISVMDPVASWRLIPTAIALGGHIRVGWEDNPYLPDGSLAERNAELVQTVVGMAKAIGRDVATPEEARQIIGLPAARRASAA